MKVIKMLMEITKNKKTELLYMMIFIMNQKVRIMKSIK